jgi:hypothetical protein
MSRRSVVRMFILQRRRVLASGSWRKLSGTGRNSTVALSRTSSTSNHAKNPTLGEELAALAEVLVEADMMAGVGVEALRLPWRTARGILLRPV